MSSATLPPAAVAEITSELVEYRNAAGLRIRAYFDCARGGAPARKFAVMAPKYGETKKNNLQLSYELVANGMSVLRFDLTNHIGESEGQMTDFTLPGAVSDIVASVGYLERKYAAEDIIVVASSLSARCALRAAALLPQLSRVICLVGVVNLHHTLFEVYKEDIFGTFLSGRRWGITDILGFNINGEIFLKTAVDDDLYNLGGTIRDLDRMQVPVEYFYAENDAWVKYEEVTTAFRGRVNCRLHPVKGAMHELRENPKAADRVYESVVATCLGRTGADDGIVRAPIKCVLEQNRVERNRLKRIAPSAEDETKFWSDYFEKYKLLEHSKHYQEYLELLGQLLGPFNAGQAVLDAGCGNGLFGLWLVRHIARQRGWDKKELPCIYVGADLTLRGLADSIGSQTRASEPSGEIPRSAPGLLYTAVDFELLGDPESGAKSRLPFADDTFDAICCSLVVSYVKRPEVLLSELGRILKPGGILVVSSLKPHCDLSEIYRGFIDQQVSEDDVEAARNLLRAATTIRLKEEAGHYAFYSEQDLAGIAHAAGFRQCQTHRSFGNQANVLRTVK